MNNIWIDTINQANRLYVSNILKHMPLYLRALRRVHLKSTSLFGSIWFDRWKYSINDYDAIILFDSEFCLTELK
jgi:hypothetical protein